MRVAVVDIGTNSTRLLVADVTPGAEIAERVRESTVTRLGEGVDATGRLGEAPQQRVFATLEHYAAQIREQDCEASAAVMTSAVRDASNGAEFAAAVRARYGLEGRTLSGSEEAAFTYAGATAARQADDTAELVVIDIGGGSTELVVGRQAPTAVRSLDVGCVRVTEQFFTEDPPAPEELSAAVMYLRDLIEDFRRQVPEVEDVKQFVGLAGTVSAVAAMDLGLADYDRDKVHHHLLTRDVVEDWFRTMAMGDRDDRLGNPGLEEGRADVIVGGLCVLVSLLRHGGFGSCLVSESDILDGLCLALAGR